jgi:polyisoprenoid-binding protein YceI
MIKIFKTCFLLAVLLFSTGNLHAQILSFHHGEIEFYTASVITDIEAVTENADVKLDTQTGNIEVAVNIKSFVFEYETMQEHFNEEYMESDKFPQATFKGKTEQDISNITDEIEIVASGKMTIHGVTKEIQIKAKISKSAEYTVVKCKIPIVFKDYNIDEPSILTKSVAKDVLIKANIYLK